MQDEGEGAGGRGRGDGGGRVDNNERGSGGCGNDICGGDLGGGGRGQKKEKEEDDDRKGEKNGDQGKAFVTSANEYRRPDEFLLDSGACFHLTWNGNILFPYPQHLHNYTQPPIASINGVVPGTSINVEGTGYLNSNNIQLDGVLLAPGSQVNLVSVGQLGTQYGVSTVFREHEVKIKTACGEEIGSGRRMWPSYLFVLESFQPRILYAHNNSPYIKFYGRLFSQQ
uniref:Uncharacterized protein n=1 Tax=Oryza sativa subsp. indica TaxID=39946 RepID=A0A679B9Y9_ORYSI|nr:hypothetical protein [Oryza sativa Indica Group]